MFGFHIIPKLAHEAGIERNYVSLLELGRSSASIKMLFKIAVVLTISVSELINQVESLLKDYTEKANHQQIR